MGSRLARALPSKSRARYPSMFHAMFHGILLHPPPIPPLGPCCTAPSRYRHPTPPPSYCSLGEETQGGGEDGAPRRAPDATEAYGAPYRVGRRGGGGYLVRRSRRRRGRVPEGWAGLPLFLPLLRESRAAARRPRTEAPRSRSWVLRAPGRATQQAEPADTSPTYSISSTSVLPPRSGTPLALPEVPGPILTAGSSCGRMCRFSGNRNYEPSNSIWNHARRRPVRNGFNRVRWQHERRMELGLRPRQSFPKERERKSTLAAQPTGNRATRNGVARDRARRRIDLEGKSFGSIGADS